MTTATVTMPDLDIQEAATRKLGPLPVWGWAIAVAGAVVVVKIVKGNQTSGAQQSTGTIAASPIPDDATTGDDGGIFDGSSSLVTALQTTVGTLGNVQALQQKLIDALNQRSTLLSTRATLSNQVNGYRDSLAKCKTASCRTKQHKLIDAAQAKQKANTTTLGTVNTSIADLQKQITGANA